MADQREVSRYCHQVRTSLSGGFIQQNLGVKRLKREEWIEQNTDIVKELFIKQAETTPLEKRKLAVVCDGSYYYIQKSSNNKFQRETYSVQ